MRVSATLTGQDQATKNFAELGRRIQKRVLGKAVRAGIRVQAKAAKATSEFTDRTKALRRATIIKIKSYSNSGVTSGICGPSTSARKPT